MKKDSTAAAYDSAGNGTAAGAAPQGSSSDFSSAYDSAPAADPSTDPSADPDGDGAQDAAADLDIPAADVTKMQSLKDSGDMAGLGNYVAQFLK